MCHIVSGIFPEFSINLFAIPRLNHTTETIDRMNILLLKNNDMDIVSIIMNVLNIKVNGDSTIYEESEIKDFLLSSSMNIFKSTASTAMKETGLENIVLIFFFISISL